MAKVVESGSHVISTLNEKSLHADLKEWYSRPGDRFEVFLDGFLIDIVRGDLLVEIQTQNFSALKRKLATLVKKHPVRLVYPIAVDKWILKTDGSTGKKIGRRKSPRHGTFEDLFLELVSIPRLVNHPNFSLEVLLIREEEERRHDPRRAWRRRGWVTHERRLIEVIDQRLFLNPGDVLSFIPDTLAEPFTTADLAAAMDKPRWLAQKMAYCLREMGSIQKVGKTGNAFLYTLSSDNRSRVCTI